MKQKQIIIGTRGSPLALKQAEIVRDLICRAHPDLDPNLIIILPLTTKGDQLTDRPLTEIGGKGLFCKEIDQALLDGRVDIAVHSAKDMPTTLPAGINIGATLKREDPRDVLIAPHADSIQCLPANAIIGTASLRRRVQLQALRPDLGYKLLRGNVNTRLAKLARKEMDATLMALSGLKRLGLMEHIEHPLSIAEMLPAVGQGTLCICVLEKDIQSQELLRPLNNPEAEQCLMAERTMLNLLDGNCKTPIAGYAYIQRGKLQMEGMLANLDGSRMVKAHTTGADPIILGTEIADRLKRQHAETK